MDKLQLQFKLQLLNEKERLQRCVEAINVLLATIDPPVQVQAQGVKRPYRKSGKYSKPKLVVIPKRRRGRPKKEA